MGIQPMVFCALLGCLISLLVIPLTLLPGLMRSITAGRIRGRDYQPTSSMDEKAACNLGGIALATAFLAVATLIYFLYPEAWTSAGHSNVAILWTALAIFLLGLWDDYRPLRAGWKLALQTVVAIVAYFQGVQIEAFASPSGTADFQLGAWSGLVTVLWLVGLTNVIDLTKRVEGLTAGLGLALLAFQAVAGFGSGSAFASLFSVGIAGALIGYLFCNRPPTRIRLGGGGSGFVGFLVAGLTTVHSGHDATLSASVFIAVLVLPVLGIVWQESRSAVKRSTAAPAASMQLKERLGGVDESETRTRSW
jgi:UDP-GlcNAc:undecaprenyl-phosphate GlcNAc-1-phosphate transferase